jgi:hypothetical protein
MADTSSASDPTDTPQVSPDPGSAADASSAPSHLAAQRAMQEAEDTVANAQKSEGLA